MLLLLSSSCFAAIGTVSETKGSSCEIQRKQTKLPGTKGASIESMDTYVTGGCVGNITFKDDTKVKVTENSRLLIDDFVFDPKQSDAGKLAIKVSMGTVRYASGQIAKSNPQKVDIKTPTATVAVRGTDFTMTVDEAGQSLVVLVPSCKDEKDVKQYELEENRCKVGKIIVETLVGKVTLEEAFQATYVSSATTQPTPPVIVNTIESKINNNLIITKPAEVQRAVKEAGRTKWEKEQEEVEADAQRQMSNKVKQTEQQLEQARLLKMQEAAGLNGCNPSTSVCVIWEKGGTSDGIEDKGKGVAFRTNQDHYAEVKTEGEKSNTYVSITHDDNYAFRMIGDPGTVNNVVNIKQNSGVVKPK